MKLRSTPLIDASFNFAITLPLVFVTLWVLQGMDAALNQCGAISVLYLFPAFSLQAITGLFMRNRSALNKFTMSLAIALLLAALVAWITVQGLSLDTESAPEVILAMQQSWIFVSLTYFTCQLVAAALTHFVLTKEK